MKKVFWYCIVVALVLPCCTPKIITSNPEPISEQNVVEYTGVQGYVPGVPYPYAPYDLGVELKKVKKNYLEIKDYAVKNKCNKEYAIVIDMRIPCFKKRLFLYHMTKDSLITTAFVSHGIGSETFKGYLVFSNTPDSRMTSLGKYKIGESYNGTYGYSYRLHGLDSTNNNALKRAVVLHSYPTVPDEKTDTNPIVFSYGCPMVSPKFLEKLKVIINKSKTPILLSIIY